MEIIMSKVSKKFDFKSVTEAEQASFIARLSPTENGCLEWQGSVLESGYGQARFRGKVIRVHRILFFIANPMADQGKFILHKCHNRKCCNVKHLSVGTQQENMIDMARSGRGNSLLTTSHVVSIRDLYGSGRFSQAQLARMFKVAPATIHGIITRKNWKHI